MKLIAALMCAVAGPDHNPRGGGQLPNPNECNSTLTSATRGIYPYPYIYIYVKATSHLMIFDIPMHPVHA